MRPALRALLALALVPLASAAPSAILGAEAQLESEGAQLDPTTGTLRTFHVTFAEAPDPTWPVEDAVCGDLRAGMDHREVNGGFGRGFVGYACVFPHPAGALLRDMYSSGRSDAYVWAVMTILSGVQPPCEDGWTTFDGAVALRGTVMEVEGVELRGAYTGAWPCSASS